MNVFRSIPSQRIGCRTSYLKSRVVLSRHTRQVTQLISSAGPGLPGSDEDPSEKPEDASAKGPGTLWKMFEAAATTFASLAVLGAIGYGYHVYYKSLVLRKMTKAFQPGDPVLEMASPKQVEKTDEESSENWIPRPEQDYMDAIVSGNKLGRYYLLVGEKGTGKSSMIIEAMRKIDGEGVSMFEAHADLEIFRIRLGRALNYEFHEDYIGSLFSVRGPRDTTALLDIERAFNKLEKIALRRRAAGKGPLIMIVNSAHLIRDDEDGRDLLELMQQRAESWAAANLATIVFNSDDYWVYERLKRYATRMEVLPVPDLPRNEALTALYRYRTKYYPDEDVDNATLEKIYDSVGGRLNYLSRVAKSSDMLKMCESIKQGEKTWFLNKCGILGESMDDDVMDQQKYASAAMVLAKALVDQEKEEAENGEADDKDDEENNKTTYASSKQGHRLPELPLYRARQVMTRADFIQSYDHDNIFTIDSRAMVRADSVPMMNAFREICAEPGFDEYLEDTLDRISAIESINRTKEITMKDLWIEQSGKLMGKYEAVMTDAKGRETGKLEFKYKPPPPEDDEKDHD